MNQMKFERLMKEILKFRDKRDWAQFVIPRTWPKPLPSSRARLLEHFLWKTSEESRKITKEKKEKLAAEIADILIFSLLFAHETGVDIEKAILDKIRHNETRYPVAKARGSAKKYTEL